MAMRDERIDAWHKVASHPFFRDCFPKPEPLLESMLTKLDELMPKPWLEAEPGEVWYLTAHGTARTYAAITSRDGLMFFPVNDIHAPRLGVKATVITAGRRIWPETKEPAS